MYLILAIVALLLLSSCALIGRERALPAPHGTPQIVLLERVIAAGVATHPRLVWHRGHGYWEGTEVVDHAPHVRRFTLDEPFGSYTIRRVWTQDALAKIAVLEKSIGEYPWGDRYEYLPGPNSNTYVAWLLDRIGVGRANLGNGAIGKDWTP